MKFFRPGSSAKKILTGREKTKPPLTAKDDFGSVILFHLIWSLAKHHFAMSAIIDRGISSPIFNLITPLSVSNPFTLSSKEKL